MKNNIKKINLDDQNSQNLNLEKDGDVKVAIYDILENNSFYLLECSEKNYTLNIKFIENLLLLDVMTSDSAKILKQISINLKSIIKILKEYIILCDSYYNAIKSAPVQKVEALDMGRRSLHDDASYELVDKMKKVAYMDFNTARRFITLCSIMYKKLKLGEIFFKV